MIGQCTSMDKLELMDKAIAHWEDNVNGPPFRITGGSCALCQAFPDCIGCPVAEYVDDDSCRGTPWSEVSRAISNGCRDSVIVEKCVKELEFLKEVKEWLENGY